jgi:glycerol-3-phosphate acyltransferase PlsX
MSQTIAGVRVAIDAMGGDNGPGVVVAGAIEAIGALGVRALLVGPEAALRRELAIAGPAGASCEIVDAPDIV